MEVLDLSGEAGELACLMRVLHNTFLSGRRDASRRPRAVVTLEDLQVCRDGRSLGVREATEATRVFRARRLLIGRLAEEEAPHTETSPRVRTRGPSLAATMGERAA